MALLHRAEIRPSKLELLAGWLPGRPWYAGPAVGEPVRVAAYRFDDPAGEVGIETMLVRVGDSPVYQVPLTYRGAPLAGAERWLVGTTRHSVLGPRWVYDACGDPVYAAALATAIRTGVGQAEEYFETDAGREPRPPSMTVAVTGHGPAPVVGAVRQVRDGDPTVIGTDPVDLAVARRFSGGVPSGDGLSGSSLSGGGLSGGGSDAATLTGSWPGQPTPLPLARLLPR
ncbi:CG0192-related protein [Micromonospora wenchangensis]|uniref:CG0192-related protein n=1 Tax=Micromonospora wenchangensis TaxID=1185415 RepID=UPI003800E576